MRDSSDAVLLVKEGNVKCADPVEIKGRVTTNTLHRTMNRFNQKQGLADIPGLGKEATKVKCFKLRDDDKHLLGIVPESDDVCQVLHHTYTYGTDCCYYVVCSHVSLLCLIQINFSNSLLHAYQSITDWVYDQVYS